jgi:hypothetical protein
VSAPLLRHLVRRYGVACTATALVPVLLGVIAGILLPDYRQQFAAVEKLGVMKLARTFLRSDLIPPDSATFLFQVPFVHPVSMLALLVAVALPTIAFPAGARGRGTLDLLLATPLTRRSLVTTTLLFTIPFALLHAVAPFVGVWLGALQAGVVQELPFDKFARVSVESFALALFFAGVAQLLSVGVGRSKARGPQAGGALAALAVVVIWSLLAESVGTLWERAAWLKRLTPYGWFEPPQVLAGTRNPWLDSAVLAGCGIAAAIAAIVTESRRKSA